MSKIVCVIGMGNIGSAIYENLDKESNYIKTIDIKEYESKRYEDILHIPNLSAIFICVPVPNEEHYQDLTILDIYLEYLYKIDYQGLIYICSTLFPYYIDSKYIEELRLILFPQFVNERSAIEDFYYSTYFVLGSEEIKTSSEGKQFILNNFNFESPPHIELTSMEIASYFKYLRNFKNMWNVTYWNYVFNFGKQFDMDYRIIKEMMDNLPVSDCERIYINP